MTARVTSVHYTRDTLTERVCRNGVVYMLSLGTGFTGPNLLMCAYALDYQNETLRGTHISCRFSGGERHLCVFAVFSPFFGWKPCLRCAHNACVHMYGAKRATADTCFGSKGVKTALTAMA